MISPPSRIWPPSSPDTSRIDPGLVRHNNLPPVIWQATTDHWRMEGRWAASDEIAGASQGGDRVMVVRCWPISPAARLYLRQLGVPFLVNACRKDGLDALQGRWDRVASEAASQLPKEGQGESDTPDRL